MTKHRHKAKSVGEVGFRYCCGGNNCNPAAHGSVMTVEVCECGARRETNRNQGRAERGRWESAAIQASR